MLRTLPADQTHCAPFRQDLHLEVTNSQASILASRIHLKIELNNRFRDRRSLEKLRKSLLEQSGKAQSIEALREHLQMHATFWRVLGTKRAFHRTHMKLIKKPFQATMKLNNLNP